MKSLFLAALLTFSMGSLASAGKRYYAANITGDGSFSNPYQPDMAPGLNFSALIPTNSTGGPIYSFCLVIVSTDAAGQATANAWPGVVALPLKQWADGLTNTETNQIKNYLTNHGLDASDIPNGLTFGQVLRMVGRKLDANFDETQMDSN